MPTMRNIELLEAHALHDLDDENEMKAIINDVCAAALIRRLAAALSEFNIVIGAGLTAKHLERLRADHADALRDVKEQA